jgi:putative ABC transport system permease protein
MQFVFELVKLAFGDLVARPLRTLLTLSNFVISIVIAVVLIAAGGGLRDTVAEMLREMGSGQVLAKPGRTTGLGGVRRSGRTVQLRYAEVREVADTLPSFSAVAPFFYLRGGGASSSRYSIPWSPVQAVGVGYQEARQLPVVEGRWFTPQEEEEGAWVAVLNEGLRRIIFREDPAVGQWVEWQGRRLTVVGVLRDEAVFPYLLFVPYATVELMADARYVSGVVARPRPGADWDRAIRELRRVLGGIGGFSATDENALEIETNEEFTRRVQVVTAALHGLVVTIAGVSLLLGGLGVANMMVIAVTERTREIGLRKALGATSGTVFLEVCFESLLISVTGGGVGIALGALIANALSSLPISEEYTAAIQFDPLTAVISCFGVGTIAILAATIPARRAASFPPAEALRWT